ncbi:MAG: alanine dehydrogenase [Spirochaetes bacterium]|nr:alanine dehydrogenase [Spirochaetota bacterium]
MNIGIPREIKTLEGRVAMTPAGVMALAARGHRVCVETGAGTGSGFGDEEYRRAGAVIAADADATWRESEMIIKVKEPIGPEFDRMREGLVLFTYLHLAADEYLTRSLLERKIIGIAYETVQTGDGSLPLLAPMSEVAGRLAVQAGGFSLEAKNGGRGVLLSGVPGVSPASVVILGGGIAGLNAAHLAAGLGARVRILDVSLPRLRYLADIFRGRVATIISNDATVAECVAEADLVIGTVLIPGARAPKLVTRDLLKRMKRGAVLVDVAIDQGGCAETSRATTHADPVYAEESVIHYCVANMPGAVPRTSTLALTNATLPHCLALADKGWEAALAESPALASGLNVCRGRLTRRSVAEAFGLPWEDRGAA